MDASVGSVGDAYDNALAESQIGIYKTELIRPEVAWRDVEHVEIETLHWVDWFNTEHTHESIDDLKPIQTEQTHYAARNRLLPTGRDTAGASGNSGAVHLFDRQSRGLCIADIPNVMATR